MNRYFAIAVALLAGWCIPVDAGVMLRPGADDFRIANVTDLDIGGVLYDATFEHGIGYDEFLLLHSSLPTFISDSLASIAILALRQELNSLSIDPGNAPDALFTELYVVPQATMGTAVIAASDRAISQSPLIYGEFGPAGGTSLEISGPYGELVAWVGFSPSAATVPEPNSAVAWGLGSFGLTFLRRSRRARRCGCQQL